MDPAASEFYRDGAYHLDGEGRVLTVTSWSTTGSICVVAIPIVSLEDGMAEEDWDGWATLTAASARRFSWSATTSSSRTPTLLQKGIDRKAWRTRCSSNSIRSGR